MDLRPHRRFRVSMVVLTPPSEWTHDVPPPPGSTHVFERPISADTRDDWCVRLVVRRRGVRWDVGRRGTTGVLGCEGRTLMVPLMKILSSRDPRIHRTDPVQYDWARRFGAYINSLRPHRT